MLKRVSEVNHLALVLGASLTITASLAEDLTVAPTSVRLFKVAVLGTAGAETFVNVNGGRRQVNRCADACRARLYSLVSARL